MGGTEGAVRARCVMMAIGLVLGDSTRIGQEKFRHAFDKWKVGLGLLPRIGQPTNPAHDNDFHGSGWLIRFRSFMRPGVRILVIVGLVIVRGLGMRALVIAARLGVMAAVLVILFRSLRNMLLATIMGHIVKSLVLRMVVVCVMFNLFLLGMRPIGMLVFGMLTVGVKVRAFFRTQ